MDKDDPEMAFIDIIEHLAKQCVSNAESELKKTKEFKDMLELPSRKENWDIQENAELKLDEHFKKAMSYLQELVILTKGLETFRNGMIYNTMKGSNRVKVE